MSSLMFTLNLTICLFMVVYTNVYAQDDKCDFRDAVWNTNKRYRGDPLNGPYCARWHQVSARTGPLYRLVEVEMHVANREESEDCFANTNCDFKRNNYPEVILTRPDTNLKVADRENQLPGIISLSVNFYEQQNFLGTAGPQWIKRRAENDKLQMNKLPGFTNWGGTGHGQSAKFMYFFPHPVVDNVETVEMSARTLVVCYKIDETREESCKDENDQSPPSFTMKNTYSNEFPSRSDLLTAQLIINGTDYINQMIFNIDQPEYICQQAEIAGLLDENQDAILNFIVYDSSYHNEMEYYPLNKNIKPVLLLTQRTISCHASVMKHFGIEISNTGPVKQLVVQWDTLNDGRLQNEYVKNRLPWTRFFPAPARMTAAFTICNAANNPSQCSAYGFSRGFVDVKYVV